MIQTDELKPLEPGLVPLIARSALESGFHIENGRKAIGDQSVAELEGDREVLNSHLGVRFFEQLVNSAGKIMRVS